MVFDRDPNSIPTDHGELDPEDLGGDVWDLLGDEEETAATTATTPTTTTATTTVARVIPKPKADVYRVRKFRIVVPAPLRQLFKSWRKSAIITKNEAIRLVNEAEEYSHVHLHKYQMAKKLVSSKSDFVRNNAHRDNLVKCPESIRGKVVREAIASRKAIITQQRHGHIHGPLPDVSLCSEEKDSKRGYVLGFAAKAGSITFDLKVSKQLQHSGGTFKVSPIPEEEVLPLKLKMMPQSIRQAKDKVDSRCQDDFDALIQIRLQGQKQRKWLIDICKKKTCKRSGVRYQLPREWYIQRDRFGDYNLIVRYRAPEPAPSRALQALQGPINVKSIDPGVRTALTIYSSEGQVVEVGNKEDTERLEQLRTASDRLTTQIESRDSGISTSQRRRLKKQRSRLLKKYRNLVEDFCSQVVHYLATSSDVIVMPRMEIHSMINRRGSKLHRKTKRALKGWSHCKLLHRLALKCLNIVNDARFQRSRATILVVQPEAYTSKTCASCGLINEKLGSKKVFKCNSCDYVADRDHNGAINMLIKAMRS